MDLALSLMEIGAVVACEEIVFDFQMPPVTPPGFTNCLLNFLNLGFTLDLFTLRNQQELAR